MKSAREVREEESDSLPLGAASIRPELGNSVFEHVSTDISSSPTSDTLSQRVFRAPKGRIFLACTLLLIGTIMLIVGGATSSWSAFGISFLALIPGAYMVYIYWQVYRGTNPAFTREQFWDEVYVE